MSKEKVGVLYTFKSKNSYFQFVPLFSNIFFFFNIDNLPLTMLLSLCLFAFSLPKVNQGSFIPMTKYMFPTQGRSYSCGSVSIKHEISYNHREIPSSVNGVVCLFVCFLLI